MNLREKTTLAYIIGVALGDGNLSNPNGRAIRLRVTCDAQYPDIAAEIVTSLQILFPKNKVSYCPGPKETYFNISLFSNKLEQIMPWQVGKGSKMKQQAHVPTWILENIQFSKACLRGLIQTDGSIYQDRGYSMINFTNIIYPLAEDVLTMMTQLGYKPRISKTMQKSGNLKYTVRLARDVDMFMKDIISTKS